MRVLVIGGGPAGHGAALAYRHAGGDGEVTLIGAEGTAPYSRPPLSKDFLAGDTARADLPLADPEEYRAHDIALRLGVAVVDLRPADGIATLADGTELPFDACVLATGSSPVRPPIPGAEDRSIHTLRTVEDAERLRAAARSDAAVAVVGAGFIGCEAASTLALAGARVTLVAPEDAPQASRLGDVTGARIAGWLREDGVDLRLSAQVEVVATEAGGHELRLAGGERVAADHVLLATGAAPRLALARRAGLVLEGGGVAADAGMRTSAPSVLVAGDIAAAHHPVAGRRLRVEHWGDAVAQGEVAGRTLAGEDASWSEPPGFWSTIGGRTLKLTAWGDGVDAFRVEADEPGRLVVRHLRDGQTAGMLSYEDDDAYDEGRRALAAAGAETT